MTRVRPPRTCWLPEVWLSWQKNLLTGHCPGNVRLSDLPTFWCWCEWDSTDWLRTRMGLLEIITDRLIFRSLELSLICYLSEALLVFSHSVMSDSLQPQGLQHARLSCPSPYPRPCSKSCPLSRWCHATISSSVVPFSSCLQFFRSLGTIKRKSLIADSTEVKVAQLCPSLCSPLDYTVHGILQARILEWVAFPFSRGSSQPRDRTQVSCIAGGFFTSWATREAQEHWSG